MKSTCPPALYAPDQVYELDRLTIECDAQPARQLMFRAALAVWRNIQLRWPEVSRMLVLAGSGNNGGDAYAVACLARDDGVAVELVIMGEIERQSQESAHFRRLWLDGGGHELTWSGEVPDTQLIVDGLLGIGLNKELDSAWCGLIEALNDCDVPRVCIDIPSGLNASTGTAQPVALHADMTVSFIGRKIGCFVADGPDYCGELVFDALGVSKAVARRVQPLGHLISVPFVPLPEVRPNNSHKNKFGHVLVVGGSPAFAGAAVLAGQTALRSGAGLVSLCLHPDSKTPGVTPELMVGDWGAFKSLAEQASVLVVGPGLGRSGDARQLLDQISGIDKPMVIDAEALSADFLDGLTTRRAVLTPHPGEAARLLGCDSMAIQRNRVQALQTMLQRFGLVSVLKGSGTLVGEPARLLSLCPHGHAGMATAGMGDVLAGLIGGLLAQGMEPGEAARSGVLVHALAAEAFAEENHADCLIATDVSERIMAVMTKIAESTRGSRHANLR